MILDHDALEALRSKIATLGITSLSDDDPTETEYMWALVQDLTEARAQIAVRVDYAAALDRAEDCNAAMRPLMHRLRELTGLPAEGESAIVEAVERLINDRERMRLALADTLPMQVTLGALTAELAVAIGMAKEANKSLWDKGKGAQALIDYLVDPAMATQRRRIPGTTTGDRAGPVPPLTDPIIRCDKCGTAWPNDGENHTGLCGACGDGHGALVSREEAARIINHHQDYIATAEHRLDDMRLALADSEASLSSVNQACRDYAADLKLADTNNAALKAEMATAKRDAYIEGLRAYAWWKDGTEYVGTCGQTLKGAIALATKKREG